MLHQFIFSEGSRYINYHGVEPGSSFPSLSGEVPGGRDSLRSGPAVAKPLEDGTPEGTDPSRDSELGAPPKRINHIRV